MLSKYQLDLKASIESAINSKLSIISFEGSGSMFFEGSLPNKAKHTIGISNEDSGLPQQGENIVVFHCDDDQPIKSRVFNRLPDVINFIRSIVLEPNV